MAHLHVWHWAVLATATAATAFDGQPVGSDSSESPRAVDAATTPPPPQQHKKRYLSSWSYTIGSSAPAYKNSMWTADDFITKDATDGKERVWQNLIMVTGNDTYFAELSAEILRRTGQNLPMLWYWGGWRNEPLPPRQGQNCSDTPVGECWTGCPYAGTCAGGKGAQGSCNECGCNEHNTSCKGQGGQPYEKGMSLKNFSRRYEQLKAQFPHLPATPWGIFAGDEPDLARHPERITLLSQGMLRVKEVYPEAITYLNMLYASIGCPGSNPGGPFLCNTSMWHGDPTALAVALGKMRLDWISTDEYYDVAIAHYQAVYRERLYPHLRPDQRVVLLPFAAYCEIGCQHNTTIAGPRPQGQNCSDTPVGECWTGCPYAGTCAGGKGAQGSCNECGCNEHNTSCKGQGRQPYSAESRCLGNAKAHLAWAESDPRVIGLFIYRLKNLWQRTDMAHLDVCQNPWGTGLGLVDRCGIGGSGDYATPQTLEFYQQNVSKTLSPPVQ